MRFLLLLTLAALLIPGGAQAGENLLQNSSMKAGEEKPDGWRQGGKINGVEYSWIRPDGDETRAALCIKKTSPRYFPIAAWMQKIERTGDQPVIHVSAQVKAEQLRKAILDVSFLDGNNEWVSHYWLAYIGVKRAEDEAVSHDWKEYSGSVAIPPEAKYIVVNLQDYGPGSVYFTDVVATYRDENTTK